MTFNVARTADELCRRISKTLVGLGLVESPELFDNEVLPSTIAHRSFSIVPTSIEHRIIGSGFEVLASVSIFVAHDRQQLAYPAQLGIMAIEIEQIVEALSALEEHEPGGEAASFTTTLASSDTGERYVIALNTRFGFIRKRG